jgi:hypothetical protein
MDPAEWEAMADAIAADIGRDIDSLEESFRDGERTRSVSSFWSQWRELNERVRVAPAIKLDDKLTLQRRLNELSQRARQEQKLRRRQASETKASLFDALTLARESMDEAHGVADIKEVRSDLAAIRQRIKEEGPALARDDAQSIWESWQALNQEGWTRLNAAWTDNERALAALLDQAQERLGRGDSRGTKEQIKAFHTAAGTNECSHQALRALRNRARDLWREADQLGKKKHEAYLSQAGKRVEQWKAQRLRNARARVALSREIEQLEEQAARASTDVGAALLRGRLAERRKVLAEMEAEDRQLAQHIAEAELVLSHP